MAATFATLFVLVRFYKANPKLTQVFGATEPGGALAVLQFMFGIGRVKMHLSAWKKYIPNQPQHAGS